MTAEVLTERACGNCIHWARAAVPGSIKQTGNCLRYPPQVVGGLIAGPTGAQMVTNTFWPMTAIDQLCGEHRSHKHLEPMMVPIDWNLLEAVDVTDPVQQPTTEPTE